MLGIHYFPLETFNGSFYSSQEHFLLDNFRLIAIVLNCSQPENVKEMTPAKKYLTHDGSGKLLLLKALGLGLYVIVKDRWVGVSQK